MLTYFICASFFSILTVSSVGHAEDRQVTGSLCKYKGNQADDDYFVFVNGTGTLQNNSDSTREVACPIIRDYNDNSITVEILTYGDSNCKLYRKTLDGGLATWTMSEQEMDGGYYAYLKAGVSVNYWQTISIRCQIPAGGQLIMYDYDD